MCMGLGMGASVLVSRFFGMDDRISMKKSVNIMFRMLFIVSTCFSSCCSFFINIFFNWVFIFGKLGAPAMGANGAALGTLIARVFEFTIIMGFLFFKDTNIGLRIKDLTLSVKDLIGEYIRISIPVLVSDTLLGLGNSAVAVVMGHIGASFVAANSITTVVMSLATVVIQGISQASCTITGITLGKGEVEKARAQGYTFAALAGLVFKWPGFWVYIMLRIDQFIKCIVCVIRLRSGKWIKKIKNA